MNLPVGTKLHLGQMKLKYTGLLRLVSVTWLTNKKKKKQYDLWSDVLKVMYKNKRANFSCQIWSYSILIYVFKIYVARLITYSASHRRSSGEEEEQHRRRNCEVGQLEAPQRKDSEPLNKVASHRPRNNNQMVSIVFKLKGIPSQVFC